MIEGFIFIIVCEPERDMMPPYAKKGKSYTPCTGFSGVAAGCEIKRESEKRESARPRKSDRWWIGPIGRQFCAGR